MRINITGPEWAPLRSYAEAQGISIGHAARELLLVAMNANATDALFIANARQVRHAMMQAAMVAMSHATAQMVDELRAKAIAIGVDPKDLG